MFSFLELALVSSTRSFPLPLTFTPLIDLPAVADVSSTGSGRLALRTRSQSQLGLPTSADDLPVTASYVSFVRRDAPLTLRRREETAAVREAALKKRAEVDMREFMGRAQVFSSRNLDDDGLRDRFVHTDKNFGVK